MNAGGVAERVCASGNQQSQNRNPISSLAEPVECCGSTQLFVRYRKLPGSPIWS